MSPRKISQIVLRLYLGYAPWNTAWQESPSIVIPEDRAVESTFHRYLKSGEYRRIITEHERLQELLQAFHEELRFATADLTTTLILSGHDLITQVRAHILYEKNLLDQIETLEAASRT